MRRYHTFTPVKQAASLSEDAERWNRGNGISEAAMIGSETDGTIFSLKTDAGTLQYKGGSETTYTDFLRVVFEMALSFNGSEVDPEFKKVIQRALKSYEYGDSDVGYEGGEDEEAEDFVAIALENAREEAEKFEEADKIASNLPDAEKFKLRVLSIDSDDRSNIERIFAKKTDLPPPQVHEIIHNHKEFVLAADKAKDLYVQLRMLDVVVSIRPHDEKDLVERSTPTKKASAAKTRAIGKKTTNKKAATRTRVSELTGREKLPSNARITNV